MTTTKLKLPELTASQSQKHVTHNEALFFLDNLVQLSVIDKDLATPPGSPTLGDAYLVGVAPTGSWTGKTNQIASYDGSGWIFFAPAEGWKTWVNDEDLFLVWDGTAWSTFGGGGGGGGSSFDDAAFAVTDDADPTKVLKLQLSGITSGATRTLAVPNASGTIALLEGTQTFTGATTFSGSAVTVGNNTGTSTLGVGTGATTTGVTKTVNLGTGGASGSTTIVNVGSTTAGALGSLIVNTPTVTFAASVTAIGAAAANVSALYLGLGGATADATNRLSINTPAVLLNNAGTSIDMTFNKNAAGNDATLSFKTGFSTRAIAGLAGSDDYTLKVSPNGSSFFDAYTVAQATGRITIANGAVLNPAAGDLASPVDGALWYNSTTGKFRARQAGSSVNVIGGGAGITDGDKGDITVSGSGATWTIDAGAVTLAKQAALAANSLIGNNTGSAATPAALSAGDVRTLLNVANGATANSPDATLLARANHTGTQLAATISDFATAADAVFKRPGGFLLPPSGEWIYTAAGFVLGSNNTLSNNSHVQYLWTPDVDFTASDVAINVVTAGAAGSLAKVTIYDTDADGKPNALLLTTGTMDCASTGVKTVACAQSFTGRRQYVIGVRASTTTTFAVSGWDRPVVPIINGGTSPVVSTRNTISRAATFASGTQDPWVWSPPEISSGAAPYMAFKRA